MNSVNITGRLLLDPQIIGEEDEHAHTLTISFDLLVSDRHSEEDREDVIHVIAHRQQTEICRYFLHRGSTVAVHGRLYTGKDYASDGTIYYNAQVIAESIELLEYSRRAGWTTV